MEIKDISLHQGCIGKKVQINGEQKTISSITADKKFFRLKEEETGQVVNDYTIEDIEAAKELNISL